MNRDTLGDRMKQYEAQTTAALLDRDLPVIARLDGRAFHTFTRPLAKPYDAAFSSVMLKVATILAVETNARMAYVQSDEITLVMQAGDGELYFGGKVFKICSTLAAQASAQFNRLLPSAFPPESKVFDFDWRLPTFDCRVFNVPSRSEAVNNLIWRQADARRNAVAAAAQANFSHRELQGKNSGEMLAMVAAAGIIYDDYPAAFRLGHFVQRRKVVRAFTCEEIDELPLRHEARMNPDLVIERTDHSPCYVQLSSLVNQESFVFDGAAPTGVSEK